ncbi:MAG: PorV/PorQ family protein [Microscillaceae bacterium]|nr:PorV/PorQ family protein [Microscillaceae bacterium]
MVMCSLVSSWAGAQTTTPKYSNEFLHIGVGARALGLANAQVAIADDVTAGYWNPAGLLQIQDKYQVSLMHAEYFAGIAQFDYVAFATPIDTNSHVGISVMRFGVDDIPDTRFLYDASGRLNYDNIRFFNSADYAFLFSYARHFRAIPGLRLGANFKIIYRNVGEFANAWGFGLDAGLQYGRKNWRLGLMLRDVTSTFTAWTHNVDLIYDIFVQTGNEVPQNSTELTLPKALLGVAHLFRIKENFGVLASLDLGLTFDGERNVLIRSEVLSIDPNVGLELDYKKLVFLRLGVSNFQRIKDFDGSTYLSYQPNFGLGIAIKRIGIDYALTDVGDQAEALYSNVFSLRIGFGK